MSRKMMYGLGGSIDLSLIGLLVGIWLGIRQFNKRIDEEI